MLFQVGGQGTRPTFFEMAAAQQLPASLRAALTYSVGVLALRRPFLHKVLDFEDEFFAMLMLVLETHSLRTTGGEVNHSGLEKRQKVLSVVILPYLKSKLHSVYNREREARLQASLWGHDDERFNDVDIIGREEDSLIPRGSSDAASSVRARLTKKIQKIIGACYPWVHASSEGLSFAYQLLYLLDATGFYSLGLHAVGIHVCRATGQELMDTSSRISKIRSHERERLRGPPWLKAVQRLLLSCTYTVLDYAQTGLIAAVFFFKMMEWWYQSAEERMSAPTVYPPPPPPPPLSKRGYSSAARQKTLSLMFTEAGKSIRSYSFRVCLLLCLRIQLFVTLPSVSHVIVTIVLRIIIETVQALPGHVTASKCRPHKEALS
ncbi:hypothetical protein TIFTF001_001063 [Ficus carica]|uniref:Pex N-terminal domain-containing protein n=1 Tax=Ficus carica TaxID=3494 RepID=A0AA88D3J2_FICCA|nr:hypothetical protein TIFTF001_001063 [Ficus carica]